MTTFTCPRHGDYTDDDYPEWVRKVWCPTCVAERRNAEAALKAAFDAAFRTWDTWLHRSGVPSRGRNRTLSNWRPHGRAQEQAGKLILRWVDGIDDHLREGRGLTLLGPPGVGKTHLACGLVAAAYELGVQARYIVWTDVTDRHKASFADRNHHDRGLVEELKRAPLLVLDEIGMRAGNEFDQALIFDLIDTRYREKRLTVVVSNLTVDVLDSIGERTADRLRETNIAVFIPGVSQREAATSDLSLIDAPPALAEPTPLVVPFDASINGELVASPIVLRKPETYP